MNDQLSEKIKDSLTNYFEKSDLNLTYLNDSEKRKDLTDNIKDLFPDVSVHNKLEKSVQEGLEIVIYSLKKYSLPTRKDYVSPTCMSPVFNNYEQASEFVWAIVSNKVLGTNYIR